MRKLFLTMRDKIIILTGLIGLFGFLIVIITVNSVKRMNYYQQVQFANEEMISNSLELKTIFSEALAGYNKPGFFAGEDNLRRDRIDSILNENNQIIEKLDSLTIPEKHESNASLEKISEFQEAYSQMIIDVIEALKQKGNPEEGAVSDLLDVSSALRNMAVSYSNNYITGLVANLKSIEAGYFSTEDPEYLNTAQRRIEEAMSYITSGTGESLETLDELQRAEFTGLVNDYMYALENLQASEIKLKEAKNNPQLALSIDEAGEKLSAMMHQTDLTLAKVIDQNLRKSIRQIFLVILITTIIMVSYLIYVIFTYEISIRSVKEYINKLIRGLMPDKIKLKSNDEIAAIGKLLMNFVEDLKSKAAFAKEIGMGNLKASYKPLSEEDILGNSLIEMEKSLQQAKEEEEKYQQEDRIRRWVNEGLAKFGEVLRQNNDNIVLLCDNIVQNMIGYLDANQGGIFIVNNNDQDEAVLELVSAFAYNKKKFQEKTILPGEGLVGTCLIEKDTIMLTEIPADYITITSGLGESTPDCLLILPLKLEDEILGVAEIASFRKFEPHEIEFAEKIATSIASTIHAVKTNEQTAKLLAQSQKQAQEMSEQEEEMRQNMEELQATQEESARRENEISGLLNAIDATSLFIEFDMKGKIIKVNSRLLELLETTENNLIDKDFAYFAGISSADPVYHQMWSDLAEGKSISREDKIRLASGKIIWLKENFSPIYNNSGLPYKVLTIATDITETRESEETMKSQALELSVKNRELNSLLKAVDHSLIKCILDNQANIIEVNDNFITTTGLKAASVTGKNYPGILTDDERKEFAKIWDTLKTGKPFTGVVKRTKKDGTELWLMSNFNPVLDEEENLQKVFYLAQDITEKKLRYKLLEDANREIESLRKKLEEKK